MIKSYLQESGQLFKMINEKAYSAEKEVKNNAENMKNIIQMQSAIMPYSITGATKASYEFTVMYLL